MFAKAFILLILHLTGFCSAYLFGANGHLYDFSTQLHGESAKRSQNFLIRPRPGRRELSENLSDDYADINRRDTQDDLSTPFNNAKRSQNFLIRPRPGKRELLRNLAGNRADISIFKNLIRRFSENKNLTRNTNKRSIQIQKFLTRPRPGKRELFDKDDDVTDSKHGEQGILGRVLRELKMKKLLEKLRTKQQ